MFDLQLTTSAQKDLDGLKEIRSAVIHELMALKENPEKGHLLKQNLQGIRALEFAIKGSGQFRAAYLVLETAVVCLIVAVGPHENFYDLVARRAKKLKGLLKEVKATTGKRTVGKPGKKAE